MMLNKASAYFILWVIYLHKKEIPKNIYRFTVNNSNRKTCEILRIKAPERRSTVFIVNFEHISHFFLVFVLTLNK